MGTRASIDPHNLEAPIQSSRRKQALRAEQTSRRQPRRKTLLPSYVLRPTSHLCPPPTPSLTSLLSAHRGPSPQALVAQAYCREPSRSCPVLPFAFMRRGNSQTPKWVNFRPCDKDPLLQPLLGKTNPLSGSVSAFFCL